jgi:fatty-acyl-CoA synthase
MHQRFDEAAYFTSVAQYRATLGLLVPTMMVRLARHSQFHQADLSSMRLLMSGGAPVHPDVLDIFNQRGIVTNQGYGMTESTAAVLVLDSHYATRKLGSCGRSTLIADVKLIASDGTQIDLPNQPGEICLRGRTIMAGYWKRPDDTAAVVDQDGWIRSGDIAYFDEDGFYFICDRLKDMIICGGENIYAAEVENVLSSHPAIFEVAVIGRPHPEWGEVAAAFVVPSGVGDTDPEHLNRYAALRLSRYKLPKEYHFVNELPKTATGKIAKPKLRELARAISSKVYTD